VGQRRTSRTLSLEALETRNLLSPLTWSAGTSLPFADGSLAAVQSGQNTFILGGSAGLIMVPSFAAANPSWKAVYSYNSPLDQPRNAPGAAVLADGTILVFGGQGGEGDPLNSAYDFYGNPSVPASMNSARYDFGYATDENHNVYAIGGSGEGAASSVESFNQSANAWTNLAPLPQGLSGLTAVGDDAGHVFAIGGVTRNGTLSATVYRYTIATNTWDTAAPLPVATSNSAAVLGSNGLIYVLGGVTGTGTTAAVESYNESTNTWTAETALPTPVSSEGATADSLGRIVVAGGFDSGGLPTANVYVSQELNQPDAAPVITSGTPGPAYTATPYTFQVLSTGNPQPTYTLTASPAGMTIDPSTGLISWTAAPNQAGTATFSVEASNYAGSTEQTYTIRVVPAAPSGVTATGASTSSIALAWNAVYDASGVTYTVTEKVWVVTGGGKGSRGGHYVYKTIASGLTTSSYTVTGLGTGSSHMYYITSVDDASGLASAPSSIVTAQTWYAPTLSPFVLLGGALMSDPNATIGQPINVSMISSGNPAPTFSLVSGPNGLSIDPNTGVVTYTPDDSTLGLVNYTVEASNAVSSVSQTYGFNVVPAPTIIFNDGPFTFNGYAFYATATAVGTDGVTPVPGTFEFFYSGPSNPPSFAGTYTVTAYFTSGVSNYGSTVATSTMIINPAQAVFGNLVSPTVPLGTPGVTLSGNLTDGALAPASGTVDVTLNGVTQAVPLGAGDTFASTFDTSALAPGTYPVTYSYVPGDTDFAAQDGTSTVTITATAQTTPLIEWATPAPISYGTPLDGTQLNAAAVDPNTLAPLAGTFSYSPTAGTLLDAGMQTLNMTFTPADTADYTSASGSVILEVDGAPTTTTLTSSAQPSVFGEPVTFTASVTTPVPQAGTPTGTVTFLDGTTVLGSASLDIYGNATLTTGGLPTGSDAVTVVYSGALDLAGSTSATLTQTVSADATTTSLAGPTGPGVYGQSLTFTATVAPAAPGTGTATGAVQFKDGTTTLATVAVAADGTATFTTSALAVGSHSITAVYGGDTNFTGSTSAGATQTVTQDASTNALVSSAASSVYGQPVTLTVTVAAASPGSGVPTGKVTFLDGTTALGTITLGNGVATLKTSTLTVGSHSITAVYAGDSHFATSISTPLTQAVNQDGSATSLGGPSGPSDFGQSVSFTAAVAAAAPGSGTPTGTVTFLDGATTLATVTLSGGKATLTTKTLPVGANSLTAVYNGDGHFTGSSSASLPQTVNPDASTTVGSSSVPASVYGQGLTLKATVSANAPGSGTPAGSVTFFDGQTLLGTGTLGGGSATLQTSALSVGSHSITVVYSGNSNFLTSTSAMFAQTVGPDGTRNTLTASPSTSVFGQSVTLAATIAALGPGSGTPAGTVTFYDGTTALGTGTLAGGRATLKVSSLTVGSHSLKAVYNNTDGKYTTSTSPAVTESVNPAQTTTALTTSSASVAAGQPVTFTAAVHPTSPGAGTPTGTVTFMDGTTVLATVNLTGGMAKLTMSTLATGKHTIMAVYSSDADFLTSTSAALTQTIA
jgi:hypothetical protein